jgi:hypothetical protein
MTTTSILDRPGAQRLRDPVAPGAGSEATVEAARVESRTALAELVRALGYPPHWADELERRAFAAGRVWSGTPSDEG